ncbi:MAG TPA: hypothetical protein PKH07_18030, partial [bacterium]|nr:hypothetical protein [bacterium]
LYVSLWTRSGLLKQNPKIFLSTSLTPKTYQTSISAIIPDDGPVTLRVELIDRFWNTLASNSRVFAVATPTPTFTVTNTPSPTLTITNTPTNTPTITLTPTPSEWFELDIKATTPESVFPMIVGATQEIAVTLDYRIVTAGSGARLHLSLWTTEGLLAQNPAVFLSPVGNITEYRTSITAAIPDVSSLTMRAQLLDDVWTALAEDSLVFPVATVTPTGTPTFTFTPLPTPTYPNSGVSVWDTYE